MHIILGILGTIVTILVLIKRLSDAGIDITWLNPFTWHRRRTWSNNYQGNPIFSLNDPLEVAALLATTVAKIDGEISREEKEILLSLFQKEFNKSEKESSDLLMSSIYLFGDGDEAVSKPEAILKFSIDEFTEDQASSLIKLLETISTIDKTNQPSKDKYVQRIISVFNSHFKTGQKW